MKIGLLAYGLDRPLTGVGRYTVELARALGELLVPSDLTILSAGNLAPVANGFAGRVVRLPGCRLLPALLTLGNGLVPLASRRAALDLVHDPTGIAPFLLGAGAARTVVTVHDAFPWSCPGTSTRMDWVIHRFWLPRLLSRVDRVITDSEVSARDLVGFLRTPRDRVRVIYPGVSSRYRPFASTALEEARGRLGLPGGYLLFVGSTGKRKNLGRLIQACAGLWRAGEARPLVIAGPRGRMPPDLDREITDLGVDDRVIFTGYVEERELPLLYAGADLFVFPSLYEGFGLPPLEAMACGTPVVCSNSSSIPEVVGKAALTVDPLDAGAMAEAIASVLASPARASELRDRGLARARLFTWKRTAARALELYGEVLC
ncbi:MAG: glycosyltransferase family 4 protein [Chloroflexota bacterium]